MTSVFIVSIDALPPGYNSTYKYGRGRVWLSDRARDWSEKAALIIGAKAGVMGWRDTGDTYEINILFGCGDQNPLDVDAPVKLVMDTVAQKLGLGPPDGRADARIVKQTSERVLSDEPFVGIALLPHQQRVRSYLREEQYK